MEGLRQRLMDAFELHENDRYISIRGDQDGGVFLGVSREFPQLKVSDIQCNDLTEQQETVLLELLNTMRQQGAKI